MTKHLEVPFEVKAVTEEGEFSGLGSVFGNIDEQGDIVEHGAFEKSIARFEKSGDMPAMLWQHNSDWPIGAYTGLRETRKGLDVDGTLALEVQRAREAHALLKMKALRGLSIGWNPSKSVIEFDNKKKIRRLKEIDLWEVSIVTFPANPRATVNAVKDLIDSETLSVRDLEEVLRDAGFSRKQAKSLIAGGYEALMRPRDVCSDEGVDPIEQAEKALLNLTVDHEVYNRCQKRY